MNLEIAAKMEKDPESIKMISGAMQQLKIGNPGDAQSKVDEAIDKISNQIPFLISADPFRPKEGASEVIKLALSGAKKQFELQHGKSNDHVLVEVRGDGNCGKRTLMFSALIQASILINSTDQGLQQRGKEILSRIREAEGNLLAQYDNKIHEGKSYRELFANQINNIPEDRTTGNEFTEQSGNVTKLLDKIESGQVGVMYLAKLANSDVRDVSVEHSGLNIALAELASCMMYMGCNVKSLEEAGVKDGVKGRILSMSKQDSDVIDRQGFCDYLGIHGKNFYIDNNGQSGVTDEVIEQNKGKFDINYITTEEHTRMIISGQDFQIMQKEITEYCKYVETRAKW
ncbi:hypothetical protein MIDIC_110019 [Alphaproteobacteria bacterium]